MSNTDEQKEEAVEQNLTAVKEETQKDPQPQVQGAPEMPQSQQQPIQQVQNLPQAIDVLMQAANVGKAKNIYSFKEAGLIGQAMDIINAVRQQNVANQAPNQ